MKAAATIRKASAYLTTFDTPQPANDLHDASKSPAEPQDTPAQPVADPPVLDDEPQNSVEAAALPEPDISRTEATVSEIETKITLAIEAERQAAEQRLRQAREDWTTEIADSLAHRLEQSIVGAIDSFRDDVAGILTPFVSQEIFNRTIEELTDNIKKALAGAIDPAIEMSGPADVIDKVSRALADRDIAIITHEAEQIDVRVRFGSTTIETALETWLTRLAAIRRDER